ncbi:MAG: MGMT family protein [Apibacter sp.]|jgi:methylated-DNA-protein-cysteine methyltransferase related protein|uniref:Methylated-DNA-protein-cysteine methyltransferase related protein n=1 Tax=Apibacter mensalis TaxID=1586267 RepID=A0A0X3ANM0_9FLAO|nr:MGMT family protein [Apibacter mensalis]MCO6564040.1 MGMT family protein [Apibacter sp.]CVK15833.1 methylated-DNA-protein-cysteine methyltransferase related protein [Apibacter mensalis]
MKTTNFYEKVYQIVRRIPYGKVTTYGLIAAHLGVKSSSRMVGYAMNSSHSLPNIPAHRVVNRNGMLTGKFHFPTPTLMEELLQNEGIRVKNDMIINFKNYLWIPEND